MKKFEIKKEKGNIIVWLDFDAYSYINFGIIIELAKLEKPFQPSLAFGGAL
mgnify:CR=1 FL=1